MKITSFDPFISTPQPDETANTASSKATMMVSPSGFVICIIRHIK